MRNTTAWFWLGRLNAVRLSGLSVLSPRRALLTALALLPLLLPGCGGGGDAAAPETPKLTSISVSPSSASLGVGQTQSISVEARDQTGQLMTGVVFTWASSNSSVASVASDVAGGVASGVATGLAAGTTNITASSAGVVSNAASLQVIVVAKGSVAIDKPSVFLSATGQSAQLAAQLFDAQGDLSALAHEEVPDAAIATAQGAVWERGSLTQPGKARALTQARAAADVIEPFKAFTCKASIKLQVTDKPIQLAVDNKLQLTWKDQPGYSKHALEGTLAIIGTAGITLKAGAKATGRCDAQRQIKLNAAGWLKLLPLPAVRFGLGVQLNAEVLLVQADLGVDGRIELRPTIGWECGGASASRRALDGSAVTDKFKTKSKSPSENDMQAKVSAQFYAVAGLDAELAFGAIKGSLVEARMGPKQSFDLAFAKDHAARREYASSSGMITVPVRPTHASRPPSWNSLPAFPATTHRSASARSRRRSATSWPT